MYTLCKYCFAQPNNRETCFSRYEAARLHDRRFLLKGKYVIKIGRNRSVCLRMINTTAVSLIPGLTPYGVDRLGRLARERGRRWKTYLFL